jgi:hypothetical protein
MRLAGISTIEAGNQFLPAFMGYNRRFEPYRVFRRLLILEGWSHDQAYTPVFS